MKILFFGRLSELVGGRVFDPPTEVRTLQALRDWLDAGDALLGAELSRAGAQIALNREIARDLSTPFGDGDEIAFMSPLSGG